MSQNVTEDYSTESQKKVYTIWANSILNKRNLNIVDLFEDLRDGVYLINILEILTSEKSENYIVKPKNRLQQLSNVQLALNVIDRWGISLVNCRPEHLVDKHSKMTLSLIWRLISKFQIQQFLTDEDFGLDCNNSNSTPSSIEHSTSSNDLTRSFTRAASTVGTTTTTITSNTTASTTGNTTSTTSTSTLAPPISNTVTSNSNNKQPTVTAKEALLRWCRREIESYTNATSITNFNKSFQSPQLFYCLVHKYCPEHIGDLDSISKQDEVEALNKCFDIAEKQLGIPKFLTPQNIIEGPIDEYCVMTYISYFLNYHRNGTTSTTNSTNNNSTSSTTTPMIPTSSIAKKRASITVNTNLNGNNSNSNNSSSVGNNSNNNSGSKTPSLLSTPEKLNFTSPSSSSTSPRPPQKQPSPSQIVQNPTTTSSSTSSQQQQLLQQQQQHNNSIIEIINNFTKELKRFSEQHEGMLIRTAAILDEKVNKLGDKLDQLETKISSMKTVISSISENSNNNNTTSSTTTTTTCSNNNKHQHHHHLHHHGNSTGSSTNNTSEENSPSLDKKKKKTSSSSSSSSITTSPPLSSSTSPQTTTTTTTTTTPSPTSNNNNNNIMSKIKETQQQKDERREKRRSRRKEKEERRQHRASGSVVLNGDGTLTQSSSSCSLTDEAHVDREEVKKIIKSQALIRGYLARKRYKRIKNRREVAAEILKTEETYVNSLTVLLQEYLIPLKSESAGVSSISADNVKTLNNNIEVILNMNNMLLKRLKERMSTAWHYQTLFGDIFFKMSDLLKCYIAYVNHYNRALSTVNDFTKNSNLAEFINNTFMRTHQQLRDLIIIPVQRIPRYVLLLEEMCKVTDLSHPDYVQLGQSLTKMQSIADHVNEKRRDFENVIHVSLLQEAISGFNIMEYSSLRYIMEGDLQAHIMSGGSGFGTAISSVVGNAVSGTSSGNNSSGDLSTKSNNNSNNSNSGNGVTTPLHVFLFNQMLVVCKYKKGKDSYFANKTLFGTNNEKHKSKQPKYKYLSHHLLASTTKLSSNKSENWFGIDNGSDYRRFFSRTVAEKDMWIQHIQPCIDKATEIKTFKDNKK